MVMVELPDCIVCIPYYAAVGGGIILSLYLGHLCISAVMKKKKKTVPQNVVLLYEYPRSSFVPNASPFTLKVETYMRMAKISYETDHSMTYGKKGKLPWIELNGEAVYDSYFIIQHLRNNFNVKLDANLSDEQKAIARLLEKTMEENTFWATLVQDRMFDYFDESMKKQQMPYWLTLFFKYFYRPKIAKYRWGHGIGRHSSEEIHKIGECDLRAMSTILGDKKYFLGDKPSSVDATMFAFLAQLIYGMAEAAPCYRLLNDEVTNLKHYISRMKTEFWPDWDDLLVTVKPSDKKNN